MLGSLLAGAVGDALGAPIEFASWSAIKADHGAEGVTGYLPAYGRNGGAITDDTQMTLFTAEGLLRARGGAAGGSDTDAETEVLHAYLRWLTTQDEPWPAWRSPAPHDPRAGLVEHAVLHHRRAPGVTCLGSLLRGPRGSIDEPINNSKGCGGVMRAAPAGLVGADDPFRLGAACAALTHGHPSGYLSAGVLASVVAQLVDGVDLDTALDAAMAELLGWAGHEEPAGALEAVRSLAARGRPTPADLESLGGGWTGEEALAISVACALTADTLIDGLLLAVNHSGDSDSTGSITGNLLGAVHGGQAIPPDLIAGLEAADLITEIAENLASGFDDRR